MAFLSTATPKGQSAKLVYPLAKNRRKTGGGVALFSPVNPAILRLNSSPVNPAIRAGGLASL